MALDLLRSAARFASMSGSLVAEAGDQQHRQRLALGRYLEDQQLRRLGARRRPEPRRPPHGCWPARSSRLIASATCRRARPTTPWWPPTARRSMSSATAMAACYVINIGRVCQRYGARPAAKLSRAPALYYREEDLYLTDGVRRIAIEGNYLSARRDVEEEWRWPTWPTSFCTRICPAPRSRMARWCAGCWLAPRSSSRSASWGHTLSTSSACASAESRWHPTSAARARRGSRHDPPDALPGCEYRRGRGAKCAECSDAAAGRTPSCYVCQGLTDADILADIAGEGQRGPLFASMSRINIERYGPHLIHFFYMRVGREVARVEIPLWVAEDTAAVDLIHTLIYDQCMKGQGYPVVLARAHEQAIVRAADRRAFLTMVEGGLLRAELPATDSRKRESKERQAV